MEMLTPAFFWLLASLAVSQSVDQPVRAVPDPGTVTTRQAITPAGVPAVFQGRIYAVRFTSNPTELWTLGVSHAYRLDWKQNKVLERVDIGGTPGLQGLAIDATTGRAFAAGVQKPGNQVRLLELQGVSAKPLVENLGMQIAGGPVIAANVLAVPLVYDNQLAVIDRTTNRLRGYVKTGIAPFGLALNSPGTIAWVSNWGGKFAGPQDAAAPTGYAPNADRVVVSRKGAAAAGSLMRVDLEKMEVTHTVATEPHPVALAWDEKRHRLYLAASNRDLVQEVDTQSNRVLRSFPVQPFSQPVYGISPTALALSSDGSRLYVACGGINAVAVMDTASGKVLGTIPTAWYPSSLDLSADGKWLAVGSLLGSGSGWREAPGKRYVHAYRGAVNVLAIPDAAQLASYTRAVAENNRMNLPPVTAAPNPNRKPAAIPERVGEPSLLEHIVYIVKENRTYDQVFGDIPKGNGDPSLTMFGEDVTPNQHRLADQFVLLDNFYATGGNSADGHQWLTQAHENAYAMWPAFAGRSYPFDGSDPLAISDRGALWDAAAAKGRTVSIYGEYAGVTRTPLTKRGEYLERWKRGDTFANEWKITAPIASVDRFVARHFPAYTTAVPDVVRARIFIDDVKKWQAAGKMPHLVLLQLPSDHTNGTTPGTNTPKAMVADNDYAVGQVVEALTQTPFWKKMAIFIVEDDAQNGVDHVDGHRTVALAISPYIRRGSVDSTFYANQSIVKTIGLILGLPPFSLFDLIANDMRASFTDTPDFTPYQAVEPRQSLVEQNPIAQALQGLPRKAAEASARMKWHLPDAAPTGRLNEILWGAIKGWNTPYPGVRQAVFAPLSLEVDDDDR